MIKGYVNSISSEPLFLERGVRFTMVSSKALSYQELLRYYVYNYKNKTFSTVVSLQKDVCISIVG